MGKKKGRQSGQFSSKSKRAAHWSELHEAASDVRNTRNKAKAKVSSSSNSLSNGTRNGDTTSLGTQRKVLTSMTRLKGLLRERLLEDRVLESNFRQQQWGRSRLNDVITIDENMEQQQECTNVGWILSYQHREFLAGVRDFDTQKSSSTKVSVVPPLEELSLKGFASVLKDYVSYFGKDFMHQRLEYFPSDLLSSLSQQCHTINNDVAFVLGNHAHLERLVLSSSRLNNKHLPVVGCTSTTESHDQHSSCLTDEAFIPLIPKMVFQREEQEGNESNAPSHDVEESWENLDLNCISYQGCWKLERLEIRDYQATTIKHLRNFLCKCPRITHLSLSSSFNAISGPTILLTNNTEHYDCEDGDNDGTIVDTLCNLQVLDLSGCSWVTYDILYSFIRRLHNKGNSFVPLELINVKGCCSLTDEMCQVLSTCTSVKNRPIVSKRWT